MCESNGRKHMSPQNAELFKKWIVERWDIKCKKERGELPPWTKDEILQSYRFCNVRREDDTVTKWIRKNWSYPNDKNIVLAMAMARMVNWPPTLEELGYPFKWDAKQFEWVLFRREQQGHKVWSSAYIVSTNGNAVPKPQYIAKTVLEPLSDRCSAGVWPTPLGQLYNALRGFTGVGSFIAGQIIADLKNIKDSQWSGAPDWWTFVVPGPGSRRGLARLLGKPAPYTLSDKEFDKEFSLAYTLALETRTMGVPELCAQDVQNCLCEFDKYMRVRQGEGRPRQRYFGV